MNFEFDTTESQIVFQSLRSILTVVGLAGVVVVFVEGGTGTVFETFDRLAQASDMLQGLIG
ncbi:MAG TPA: hypothetical protein PLK94_05670 [Alphaproteobacteria bacterium]|nr:hypothetical protein [Alphaproteobacteria bacterium]HOO50764.1 hypothetical protein [Alphaproteobacteria bacterium]